jgi:magnesium chelatase family protein
LEEYLFLGELALDGSIRRVYGTLPILRQAIARGFKKAIIPIENEYEASFIHGIDIYEASNLAEVINHIENTRLLSQVKNREINQDETFHSTDFKDIKGNSLAKRGLEIAASGGHNLLMYGPPGTGKTLLAKSFISILPKLSPEEVIEVMSIYSASKINENKIFIHPPFRSPHHTASYASIVGGGAYPRPGEITLAHRGVLFLDELPEFNRDVLEALRQPLEERCITIARAQGSVLFPAHCIFVASMNPCPCGRGNKGCTCPPKIIEAYKRRLSGPILDRIDITFSVEKIDYDRLAMKDSLRKIEDNDKEETSREVLQRVILARNIQKNRFQEQIYLNSEMNPKHIEKYSNLESSAKNILAQMGEKMNLSGRGLHRTIKVARTIADMADSEKIKDTHILEALHYRQNI